MQQCASNKLQQHVALRTDSILFMFFVFTNSYKLFITNAEIFL